MINHQKVEGSNPSFAAIRVPDDHSRLLVGEPDNEAEPEAIAFINKRIFQDDEPDLRDYTLIRGEELLVEIATTISTVRVKK